MTAELADITVAARGGLPLEDLTASLDLYSPDRGAGVLDKLLKAAAATHLREPSELELRVRPRGGPFPNFVHVGV